MMVLSIEKPSFSPNFGVLGKSGKSSEDFGSCEIDRFSNARYRLHQAEGGGWKGGRINRW
jgi:hypothetical protein